MGNPGFHMDRTLPKKRLTQAEMASLDAIYHQIGLYPAHLKLAGHPRTPTPGEPLGGRLPKQIG
jgi:hypothetical protein